jgi:hypothetical protein
MESLDPTEERQHFPSEKTSSVLNSDNQNPCIFSSTQIFQHKFAGGLLQRRGHALVQRQDRHDPGGALRIASALQASTLLLI